MSTLIKAQESLAITQDQLLKAQELLVSMQDNPAAHFEDEMKTTYNDMLNGVYNEQFEAFPFYIGEPCNWIEENAPTDYRMGFADFEFDPSHCDKYIDLESKIEELGNEVSGIEEEIEELENLLEDE